jgi:hypothetical protein
MFGSTTFSKKNNIKNKEGRPHCWNRSKKEDHIVGTDPISNITTITVSTLWRKAGWRMLAYPR